MQSQQVKPSVNITETKSQRFNNWRIDISSQKQEQHVVNKNYSPSSTFATVNAMFPSVLSTERRYKQEYAPATMYVME